MTVLKLVTIAINYITLLCVFVILRAGTDPVFLLSGYPFTIMVEYPDNWSKKFMTCLH